MIFNSIFVVYPDTFYFKFLKMSKCILEIEIMLIIEVFKSLCVVVVILNVIKISLCDLPFSLFDCLCHC